MERFLELSGLPVEGIRAHVRAERRYGGLNLIQLDENTFTIHKRTCANNSTESFEIGEEKVTHSSVTGRRKSCVVSVPDFDSGGYMLSARTGASTGSELHMLEKRYVIDGGLSHVQEIHLQNLTSGGECTTTRTWFRVPMTEEHRTILANLPPQRSQRPLSQDCSPGRT